jgi:hypothetical protein
LAVFAWPYACHLSDAGTAGKGWPQQIGKDEMPEMVGRELRLPAASDARLGVGHHGRVVDQDVDLPAGHEEAPREVADGVEVSQVERVDLDSVDPGKRLPCMFDARAGIAPAALSPRVVSRPMPE